MAAVLIILVLVAVLAYVVCLDVRLQNRPPARSHPGPAPDELSEVTLTKQLIAGTIEPSVYRRLVSELAHSTAQPDGRRWTSP